VAPLGGRGVEGLAIAADGRVAVLWEGGWLSAAALPFAASAAGGRDFGGRPLAPLVCVHELLPDTVLACPGGSGVVALDVPAPPDPTHAFRATDLVWSRRGDELVVLLGSVNRDNDEFRFRWLQRFSESGAAVDTPLNLCDPGLLPDELRAVERNNYEGLAWFDAENLVLVNDTTYAASAFLVDVDPWPSTDATAACY